MCVLKEEKRSETHNISPLCYKNHTHTFILMCLRNTKTSVHGKGNWFTKKPEVQLFYDLNLTPSLKVEMSLHMSL